MDGISSVTDSPRPGQAHRVVTSEAIAAVEAIMKENRRVTVNEIAAHTDKSNGSAHHTVHDILQFHKVSAMWVPRQLHCRMKERRVDACQDLLKRFEAEGYGFLGRNVREMKPGSTTTSRKVGKIERGMAPYLLTKTRKKSAGKVMLTLFWEKREVILEHYMPRGNPVTSTTYVVLLKNHLRP